MKNQLLCLTLFLFSFALGAHAQGDAGTGKAKAAVCAACHGADGNSINPVWPTLAGQGQKYLAKQLHDFKSGARKNTSMSPMAAPLSDEDIDNLAAYFSIQKRKPGAADKALVALGEKIYRGGKLDKGTTACMACHGPTGAGNPAAGYPALEGQHPEYTTLQLKAFRQGDRGNDPAGMMRMEAASLSDDEIKALASYVSGLH